MAVDWLASVLDSVPSSTVRVIASPPPAPSGEHSAHCAGQLAFNLASGYRRANCDYFHLLAGDAQAKLALIVAQIYPSVHSSVCLSVRYSLSAALRVASHIDYRLVVQHSVHLIRRHCHKIYLMTCLRTIAAEQLRYPKVIDYTTCLTSDRSCDHLYDKLYEFT